MGWGWVACPVWVVRGYLMFHRSGCQHVTPGPQILELEDEETYICPLCIDPIGQGAPQILELKGDETFSFDWSQRSGYQHVTFSPQIQDLEGEDTYDKRLCPPWIRHRSLMPYR